MAVYFGNCKSNNYVPMYPSTASTNAHPKSTDIGSFIIDGSSGKASLWCSTGFMAFNGEDAQGNVVGILAIVNSSASTDLLYVQPIETGDILDYDYSTTYAGSTADVITSSNIGKFVKSCKSTGSTTYGTPELQATLGKFIDPSTVSATFASTSGFSFQLVGFSTQQRKAKVKIWNKTSTASGVFV